MSIGEFAQLSGLTVKALRHYDERAVLVPARVDPHTRYRAYSGSQLRDAVVVKVLRAAGMPVDDVRLALAEPDTVAAVLAGFQERVAAERAAQDAALALAGRTLAALDRPVEVDEREVGAIHFAAVVEVVATDGRSDGTETARFDAGFGALHQALARRGVPPSGPWWSSFRAIDATTAEVEMSLCWPLPEPAPADLAVDGRTVRSGTLSAGRELVVRMLHETDAQGDGDRGDDVAGDDVAGDDDIPEDGDTVHPAVVALLEHADERGLDIDLAGLRQVGILGPDRMPIGIELALRIR